MTTADRAVQAAVNARPQFQLVGLRYLSMLDRGLFPQWLVDAVVQQPKRLDHYDGFIFGSVVDMIERGEVSLVRVPLGREPYADRLAEENNEALAHLSVPFRARFWGGLDPRGDGVLRWTKPIELLRLNHPPEMTLEERGVCNEACQHRTVHSVRPSNVTLEVGSVPSSRFFERLTLHGGVARWPYGAQDLHLFLLKR